MKKISVKSKVMRSAWAIYRHSSVSIYTWSQALTRAWACHKIDVEVYTRKLFNGRHVLGFSKNGFHAESPEDVVYKIMAYIKPSNSGAVHDYGTGKYQGD